MDVLGTLMYGGGFAVSPSLAGLLEPVSKHIVAYCLKLVTCLDGLCLYTVCSKWLLSHNSPSALMRIKHFITWSFVTQHTWSLVYEASPCVDYFLIGPYIFTHLN